MLYRGGDRARLARSAAIAHEAGVPLIAVNDVHFHHPDRRPLADVLTCIREKVTIDRAGRRLAANAERHLKAPEEMARLFRDCPEAIEETLRLSEALTFSLDELKYEYPDERMEGFASPQEALEHLAWQGAARRYPQGIDEAIRQSLAHEFALIAQRQYAPYFLTVHDIVRYARSQGILCQGRGSAANSTVCYCLGITEVDPVRGGLLFERFISTERQEPPDIDVDFEHERREEVIQYIYKKYGRDRAGIAATVISYRGRSAIREVGKAFGLSEDSIGALTSSIWGGGGGAVLQDDIKRAGLDPQSPRMRQVATLAAEIRGFPRHLSQHVGGFVITRSRLDEVMPIGNAAMDERTFVEWDKDDLDALGILKVDVLGLGMLSCLRKAFDLAEQNYGERLTLASIPAEDPAVYRMLSRADSLGVFQVESRAQMSMLPRLRPSTFYDLVIEVAIVRPGPIQGDMVHPYLRRKQGLEPVAYPSKELEAVLAKTLGVPLFQEQAMKIAIVAGGFTPSEADKLRRAMATFKRTGTIGTFRDKMINGMLANGYERDFAERCFGQIEGFGEYGFPESHAASFALLVYASAWLKCHYPDVFAAALLNAQPMGFYAPAQIVRDAREHGVEVRPPDVNFSAYDATLEPGPEAAPPLHALHRAMASDIRTRRAVRLGLREIQGLKREDAELVESKRGNGYDSLRDLWLRTGLPPRMLERLADADAFGSLGLSRRDALWAVKALGRTGDHEDLPLFRAGNAVTQEPDVALIPMPPGEEVVNDYRFLRLSLRAHPSSFLRADLDRRRIIQNERLRSTRNGARVHVSGLITVRQRPGTAKGVIFMTIEDETSIANVIVWPKIFERFRPIVLGARYVAVSGSRAVGKRRHPCGRRQDRGPDAAVGAARRGRRAISKALRAATRCGGRSTTIRAASPRAAAASCSRSSPTCRSSPPISTCRRAPAATCRRRKADGVGLSPLPAQTRCHGGLVPAIPIKGAMRCPSKRDARHKAGHDSGKVRADARNNRLLIFGNTAIMSSSTRAPGVESWLTHTVVLAGVQSPKYSASTVTMPSMSRMSVRYFVTFTTSVQVRPSWSRMVLTFSIANRVWSSMRTG